MPPIHPPQEDPATAAARREYEKSRLSEQLRKQYEAFEREGKEQLARARRDQEARRAADLETARADIRRGKPVPTYAPGQGWATKYVPSKLPTEKIEKAARVQVQANNNAALHAIEAGTVAKLEDVLDQNRTGSDSRPRASSTIRAEANENFKGESDASRDFRSASRGR